MGFSDLFVIKGSPGKASGYVLCVSRTDGFIKLLLKYAFRPFIM